MAYLNTQWLYPMKPVQGESSIAGVGVGQFDVMFNIVDGMLTILTFSIASSKSNK